MPKPKDEIDLLAKQISEAARLHTRQDKVTGRRTARITRSLWRAETVS